MIFLYIIHFCLTIFLNINTIKNEFLKINESIYMSDIQNNIKTIIEEKLGNNLLTYSYNYYHNKLTKTFPKVLNNILGE